MNMYCILIHTAGLKDRIVGPFESYVDACAAEAEFIADDEYFGENTYTVYQLVRPSS